MSKKISRARQVSDWRKRCPVYEVPFSTLYTSAVKT